MEPSGLSPQVLSLDAFMDVNSPGGGGTPMLPGSPQHVTEPSVLIPQVWCAPLLMERKDPSGGLAAPRASSPQQITEPSVWSAHRCS